MADQGMMHRIVGWERGCVGTAGDQHVGPDAPSSVHDIAEDEGRLVPCQAWAPAGVRARGPKGLRVLRVDYSAIQDGGHRYGLDSCPFLGDEGRDGGLWKSTRGEVGVLFLRDS